MFVCGCWRNGGARIAERGEGGICVKDGSLHKRKRMLEDWKGTWGNAIPTMTKPNKKELVKQ